MKVLIICSGNPKIPGTTGILQPYVLEQARELEKSGVQTDFFQIKGKGIRGYLKNLPALIRKIRSGNYDILHAHYGLSGFLASLQFKRPLVITFHGSDINFFMNRVISNKAFLLATRGIFVSGKLKKKLFIPCEKKSIVLACGIDLETFQPMDKAFARNEMKLDLQKKYLLFSSAFDNPVKNFPLAEKAAGGIPGIEFIELKKKTRREVSLLLNACDALVLTSFREGSPQIIKEALACNCPVISVDVGDAREIIGTTEGCYICSRDPDDIREKIQLVLQRDQRIEGRERVSNLGLESINIELISVYKSLIN